MKRIYVYGDEDVPTDVEDLSLRDVNSVYFQLMFDAIASQGAGLNDFLSVQYNLLLRRILLDNNEQFSNICIKELKILSEVQIDENQLSKVLQRSSSNKRSISWNIAQCGDAAHRRLLKASAADPVPQFKTFWSSNIVGSHRALCIAIHFSHWHILLSRQKGSCYQTLGHWIKWAAAKKHL